MCPPSISLDPRSFLSPFPFNSKSKRAAGRKPQRGALDSPSLPPGPHPHRHNVPLPQYRPLSCSIERSSPAAWHLIFGTPRREGERAERTSFKNGRKKATDALKGNRPLRQFLHFFSVRKSQKRSKPSPAVFSTTTLTMNRFVKRILF